MTAQGEMWQLAAAKWGAVANTIGEDDWAKATPCGDWTVRELVDHAMHWQAMGGAMLGAGTTPGDDWATIEPKLREALADPANLEGVAEQMGGMPKQQAAGFVIGDLLIHSWDLARSLGADEELPAAACESTYMGLQRVPTEMLRSETMFGPPVDVGEDASIQDKMLGFVGRTP